MRLKGGRLEGSWGGSLAGSRGPLNPAPPVASRRNSAEVLPRAHVHAPIAYVSLNRLERSRSLRKVESDTRALEVLSLGSCCQSPGRLEEEPGALPRARAHMHLSGTYRPTRPGSRASQTKRSAPSATGGDQLLLSSWRAASLRRLRLRATRGGGYGSGPTGRTGAHAREQGGAGARALDIEIEEP